MGQNFVNCPRNFRRDVTFVAVLADKRGDIFNDDHSVALTEGLVFQVKARGLLSAEQTNFSNIFEKAFLSHMLKRLGKPL